MSTVFEVVAAAHCGMQVLGFSLITNKCVAPGDENTVAPSHAEVLEASNDNTSKTTMQTLVTQVCARVNTSTIPETDAAVAYKDSAAILAQAKKEKAAEAKAHCCPCMPAGGSASRGIIAHLPVIATIAVVSAAVSAGVAFAIAKRR
jgi:hypothetical protein